MKKIALAALLVTLSILIACSMHSAPSEPLKMSAASDGPSDQGLGILSPRRDGDASAGREVFRFETFGNERFWTDAVRLPAGMAAAGVTPLQALQLGLQVDIDALDAATIATLKEQLKSDPSQK